LKSLRDQVIHRGGVERWARELQDFCAGRDAWPTEREFVEAGRRSLYAAGSRKGAIARRTADLGFRGSAGSQAESDD
jgi:hypothetical protein